VPVGASGCRWVLDASGCQFVPVGASTGHARLRDTLPQLDPTNQPTNPVNASHLQNARASGGRKSERAYARNDAEPCISSPPPCGSPSKCQVTTLVRVKSHAPSKRQVTHPRPQQVTILPFPVHAESPVHRLPTLCRGENRTVQRQFSVQNTKLKHRRSACQVVPTSPPQAHR
jgi:hypothetical protein